MFLNREIGEPLCLLYRQLEDFLSVPYEAQNADNQKSKSMK